MRKILRFVVPLLLAALVIASIFWYLFIYDRAFTRDILLKEARVNDARGNSALSAWFYRMAYSHSGNDEDVALELAQQYKSDGNYTKAEVSLSQAIKSSPSAALYTALCSTYVDQDKLMDAVALLANVPDENIRAQLEQRRPTAPTAAQDPGFYNSYISVELTSSSGTIYYTTDGEYPSIQSQPYSEPIKLPLGETILYCISVDDNGLVSPVSVLSYTVGGVVEPAIFMDADMEFAIRDTLGITRTESLYTNDLWTITEFTVPEQVWTLEDLSKLTHLESLTITNLPNGSLADLASLTELKSLDLSGCRFSASELRVLEKLPNLQKLVLSNCALSTIADLENLTGLTYLDISNNTIRNLEPLMGMTGMRELYMQLNAITNLEALTSMYELEKLNISFNSVSSLIPLGVCGKLSWLDASNNTISSVNGIANLQLLQTLKLDYNQLSDVSPLGACIQLKELSFTNNTIYDISTLASLTNLETFDFSYNNISALPSWPQNCALRVIQGAHNQVNSLYSLGGMPNLTYVSMDYNSLTDISNLANCVSLVQVNVYGNSISDVSALTQHSIIVNYDPT
ncbi:MAG: leucine-rich repeat domain-containing protein [Candidatus Faecousia sp.]|nr:leucine-rich repeat domain-containing protein [Candidatus Faecousia sp.]